jgi:hypothetical protein
MIIDTESGDIVHWLELEDPIVELYDVAVLPDVVRPTAMGVADDEIRRIIRMKPLADHRGTEGRITANDGG